MKYLSFDIEAANGYKPSSICSIGIVVADEQFNIISQQNVWINPKTKYNLNGTRQNVGIDLHLDKALLDSSPDFAGVYRQISGMLTDKQYLVVGHAVDADVRMLNAACQRYNLPSIDFSFIDSQLLYRLFKGEKEVKALNKIADEMDVTFVQHNSQEDAYVTMLTLKYLVEQTGLTVKQLLDKYHVRIGKNCNFELTRPVSLDGQVSKRQLTQVATAKIKDFAQSVQRTSNEFVGKTFCIARSLELADYDSLYQLVTAIVSRGGKYSSKLAKCNVYVKADNPTQQDLTREKHVEQLRRQGLLQIITIDKLSEDYMTVEKFLTAHGQSTNNIDVNKMLACYIDEMNLGLQGKGSIPMIPTYLQNVDRDKIKMGKRILIDAGGTNFRSATGHFDLYGNVLIDNLRKTAMPASNGQELSKEEFYDQIAQNIRYLADEGDDIGFCFSYQVDMGADVDGIVAMFSKEVKAPQVIGTKVGAETLSALSKYSDKQRKIVILNDTVATLLGGMALSQTKYSAYVGYIYGTGTNLCYIEDTSNIVKVPNLPQGQMLINTESGGFDKFRQGEFDVTVANNTANPTVQRLEKMTSGKYLADVIYQAFVCADKERLFNKANISHFELLHVSAFLEGEHNIVWDMFSDDADRQIAKEICLNLIDRAAKIGAIINAGASIKSCKDKSLPVAIVAEGTTFNKLPTYRKQFEHHLAEILSNHGITYEIVQGDDLNLVGTLMATMVL